MKKKEVPYTEKEKKELEKKNKNTNNVGVSPKKEGERLR